MKMATWDNWSEQKGAPIYGSISLSVLLHGSLLSLVTLTFCFLPLSNLRLLVHFDLFYISLLLLNVSFCMEYKKKQNIIPTL